MISKNLYIIQLETDLQNRIKNELVKFFKEELDLPKKIMEEELEKAMSSRLSDLEETININKIISQL